MVHPKNLRLMTGDLALQMGAEVDAGTFRTEGQHVFRQDFKWDVGGWKFWWIYLVIFL